jgi:hypothetical protein
MLLLKRNHVTFDRDVIVVTEASEEGSSEFGVECSVKEHCPDSEAPNRRSPRVALSAPATS